MFNLASLIPVRAISSDPRNPMSPFAFTDTSLVKRTNAGETITPNRALTLAVYFACVRVISEDIAKLPLHIYRGVKPRGKEELEDHPLQTIFNGVPNPTQSSFTFRETIEHWALGWGNGFAEIVRDGAGIVRQLWPIHPSRVTLVRRDGRLKYRVMSDNDPNSIRPQLTFVEFELTEIFHIKGMGSGLMGYSIAAYAAETIGASLAAETYAASFFGQGSTASGILTHPGQLGETARQNLRDSWQKTYGGAKNSHKVAILEEGLTWQQISIPPNDAQMLETRQFQIEEVCRWFRVSPHKVQHLLRSTYSNIEQQSIEHVTDTLMPWVVRWEQEIKRSLLADEPGVYAKHNVNDLLRGDANSRANWYRTMLSSGVYSINEVRELEDENPIEDGDDHFIQINMSTVDKVASGEASAKGKPADTTVPGNEPPQDKKAEEGARMLQAEAQIQALAPVFVAEADRVLRREAMAVQRALPKADFAGWSADFFAEQVKVMVDAFYPLSGALSNTLANILSLPAVDPGIKLEEFCRGYCDEARAALGERHGKLPSSHVPDALSKSVIVLVLEQYKATL